MYKIDVVKLSFLIASITAVIVLGVVFFGSYFFGGKLSVMNNVREKATERLTKGVIDQNKKEEIAPETAILQAINANRTRTVKIYGKLSAEDTFDIKEKEFLGRGIVLSKEGLVVTGRGGFDLKQEYSVVLPGRKDIFELRPVLVDENLVFFKLPAEVTLIADLDISKPEVDELVVAIGGREKDGMATGRVLKVDTVLDNTLIYTTIPSKSIEIGTPLINKKKRIIGMYISKSEKGRGLFISSQDIQKMIKKIK